VGTKSGHQPKTSGIGDGWPDYRLNSRSFLATSQLWNLALNNRAPAKPGDWTIQPGSTYKPLSALIALDEGIITQATGYDCRGVYLACAHPIRCEHHDPGHAANLRLAIAHSCNSYFSNIFRLTIDNPQWHDARKGLTKWKEYVNAFGLGHRVGTDLASEDGANVPDTSSYDKEYRHSWNSCTMVSLGIGHDKILETPLQMANSMCIIANKGYFFTPHFVESIEGVVGEDTILNKFRRRHEVLTIFSTMFTKRFQRARRTWSR
jgi:penicillin-binding protein 2